MNRAVDLGELVAAVVGEDRERRAKYKPVLGFDHLINIDFLSARFVIHIDWHQQCVRCREGQPNELVAPAVSVTLTRSQEELIARSTEHSKILVVRRF